MRNIFNPAISHVTELISKSDLQLINETPYDENGKVGVRYFVKIESGEFKGSSLVIKISNAKPQFAEKDLDSDVLVCFENLRTSWVNFEYKGWYFNSNSVKKKTN